MICRICESVNLSDMRFEVPEEAGNWKRCRDCGSDTNFIEYDPSRYPPNLSEVHRKNIGGSEAAREQVRSNCEWFDHYREGLPNLDFLDIGCADGSALDVMQSKGWAVHGFDIQKPDYFGPHVTVSPLFTRWLFPLRYAAVLCREVIEHVPTPRQLLFEIHGVTCPNGLVQIQTPKPCDYRHEHIYQRDHLFIPSTTAMQEMLRTAMLDVIDSREWTAIQPGQAYLCRARP